MPKVELTIPDHAPVMVLPNALLFPHAMMPLYIFEPRYQEMLRWALEHDRVFCIALRKPESSEARTPEDFFHTAGLGLVRASVGREDGTSHLMLQGLIRVRFTEFIQAKPFYIARMEPLPSTGTGDADGNCDDLAPLADEVRALCGRFREQGIVVPEGVEQFLASVHDPEVLADSIAHSFLRDPLRRQELLEQTDIRERFTSLAGHLRAELQL